MAELLRRLGGDPVRPQPPKPQPPKPPPAPDPPRSAATRCGRCKAPATTTARFAYEGCEHELDLCGDCGAAYERTLLCWVRVAHEPRRPFPVPHPPPRGRRAAPPPVPFPLIRRPPAPAPAPKPFLAAAAAAGDSGYTLTTHAVDRMREGNVSPQRVHAAIRARTVVRPGDTDDEEVIYHDDLRIVVGKQWRTVVTVSVRDLTEAITTHTRR